VSRLLVVNADDMGLTPGVCRAVQRAHADGVVTSTSVLAVGTAFEQAATAVRDAGDLALGAHLAIVGEDRPLLSAREVPTLVDRQGRFPLSYRTVVARGAAGRIDADDVAREFRAQLERVRGIGVPVTHLDTHQHTHLWPAVAAVVVDLAREAGGAGRSAPACGCWPDDSATGSIGPDCTPPAATRASTRRVTSTAPVSPARCSG
jgi:chitin disaccharide deacetylase